MNNVFILECETLVQHSDGLLKVLSIYADHDIDLICALFYRSDVDLFFSENLKDPAADSGAVSHLAADDRYKADTFCQFAAVDAFILLQFVHQIVFSCLDAVAREYHRKAVHTAWHLLDRDLIAVKDLKYLPQETDLILADPGLIYINDRTV